jgi:hypothetical protein
MVEVTAGVLAGAAAALHDAVECEEGMDGARSAYLMCDEEAANRQRSLLCHP